MVRDAREDDPDLTMNDTTPNENDPTPTPGDPIGGRAEEPTRAQAGAGEEPGAAAGGPERPATEQPATAQATAEQAGPRRLYRSRSDRVIGGVCAGIAKYFGIDPVI